MNGETEPIVASHDIHFSSRRTSSAAASLHLHADGVEDFSAFRREDRRFRAAKLRLQFAETRFVDARKRGAVRAARKRSRIGKAAPGAENIAGIFSVCGSIRLNRLDF